MDGALVIVLVLAWALLLLPSALRSRRSSPHATVGGFEEAMAVLRSRPEGRELMVPQDAARIVGYEEPDGALAYADEGPLAPDEEEARGTIHVPARIDPVLGRRRRVLARLAAGAALSLLCAVVAGGAFWTVATLSFLAFGGYVALLRRWKLQREQAREVVRMLTTTERRHDEEVARLSPQPEARAVGETPGALGGWGDLQVATAPDQPWQQGAGVRIRRWED